MRKIKIFLWILAILFVVILLTFFFFDFFTKKNPRLISNVEIQLRQSEQSYESKNTNLQYQSTNGFTVTNNNDVDFKYDLIISDNCNEASGIPRTNINYQLLLNGKVVGENVMSYVQNNVLDTRVVKKGETNSYTLKVWTNDFNTTSKYYEYKLSIRNSKE